MNKKSPVLATAGVQPSLFQQVGMAGTAAVITVTFIHPIDVVKVSHLKNTIGALSSGMKRNSGAIPQIHSKIRSNRKRILAEFLLKKETCW